MALTNSYVLCYRYIYMHVYTYIHIYVCVYIYMGPQVQHMEVLRLQAKSEFQL